MENTDRELLMRIVPSNPDLRKLYDRHRKLEREVENLERYTSYSTAARLRQQELKKEKLRGMEMIMAILHDHRGTDYPSMLS